MDSEVLFRRLLAVAKQRDVKEHQWLMLAGGFTNGLLVKVVEHTRILLHTIDLDTTHSMIIVICDDPGVLVLLIYYCTKVWSPTAKYT